MKVVDEDLKHNMTDFETMKEMLQKADIEFKVANADGYYNGSTWQTIEGKFLEIVVERGYSGFFTAMTFDADGNLKDMSAWE